MSRIALLASCLLLLVGARAQAQGEFPPQRLPQFRIPFLAQPPRIDGRIDDQEWHSASRLAGVAPLGTCLFHGRDVSFLLGWDAQRLYVAIRSDIRAGESLLRQQRGRMPSAVAGDDACQVAVSLGSTGEQARGAMAHFLRVICNSAGACQTLQDYPGLGQSMANYFPRIEQASSISSDGRWWDLEMALDLDDLQAPRAHQAGDVVRLLLTRDFKFPDCQVAYPAASGVGDESGYPLGILSRDEPFVRINRLAGLLDQKLSLGLEVVNPSSGAAAEVKVLVLVRSEGSAGGKPADPALVLQEEKVLLLPPGGRQVFELDKDLPAIAYAWDEQRRQYGVLEVLVLPSKGDGQRAYHQSSFLFLPDAQKDFARYQREVESFTLQSNYNPVDNTLFLAGDTWDLRKPPELANARPAGLEYKLIRGSTLLQDGVIRTVIGGRYQETLKLPALDSGEHIVIAKMIDENENVLAKQMVTITRREEARDFAAWWGNSIGAQEKVLWPFEALKVQNGGRGDKGTAIRCGQRLYSLDSLGLLRQAVVAGANVLARPARLVVTVAGKEYPVAVSSEVHLEAKGDIRLVFQGSAEAAGLRFRSQGTIEQDGLVQIELTFDPKRGAVEVQDLRLEWPLAAESADSLIVAGPGGDQPARYAGALPAGSGLVFNTLDDLGPALSGMAEGNFFPDLWLGNEERGLLWSADTDEGWIPNDQAAAHDIVRQDGAVILRNHLISTAPGQRPTPLSSARTVRFSYNISPFKPLTPGWRVNCRAPSGPFAGGKYKVNWQSGESGWTFLSPPSADPRQWPAYYQHYQEQARNIAQRGVYSPLHRLLLFTANQLPLRGLGPHSAEKDVDSYFAPAWLAGDQQTFAPSYRDYLAYLAQRQVIEGGCAQFLFEGPGVASLANPQAGAGYYLGDGSVQRSSGEDNLRQLMMRMTALMQEQGLFPAGISTSSSSGLSLKTLPWVDAVLASARPMADPVTDVPAAQMIALSCPHNFGTAVNHLPVMNPDWAAMHDAAMAGGATGPFDSPEFLHWGITGEQVRFVPYWRNSSFVSQVAGGVVASMWRRPGSLLIAACNYGPDPSARQRTRELTMTLDLDALGIPRDARVVRISEMLRDRWIDARWAAGFPWYQELPAQDRPGGSLIKLRPAARLELNLSTGGLTGLPLFYHDTRYVVINWDSRPADEETMAAFPAAARDAILDWGITGPQCRGLSEKELFMGVSTPGEDLQVAVWTAPDRALLRVQRPHHSGDELATVMVHLDLAELGVGFKSEELWRRFLQVYDPEQRRGADGRPLVQQDIWAEEGQMRAAAATLPAGAVLFDARHGWLCLRLTRGEMRVLSIDRF